MSYSFFHRPGLPLRLHSWNEWVTLPIQYCDLPLNSQITFTVWDIGGPRSAVPVGGSTFRLFGKKWCVPSPFENFSLTVSAIYRTLRRGKHRLLLWQGQEADGSVDTKTPSKVGLHDEMGRLEKVLLMSPFTHHALTSPQLMKKFERGDLPKNEWLDKMAFRRIEEIHTVSGA